MRAYRRKGSRAQAKMVSAGIAKEVGWLRLARRWIMATAEMDLEFDFCAILIFAHCNIPMELYIDSINGLI